MKRFKHSFKTYLGVHIKGAPLRVAFFWGGGYAHVCRPFVPVAASIWWAELWKKMTLKSDSRGTFMRRFYMFVIRSTFGERPYVKCVSLALLWLLFEYQSCRDDDAIHDCKICLCHLNWRHLHILENVRMLYTHTHLVRPVRKYIMSKGKIRYTATSNKLN